MEDFRFVVNESIRLGIEYNITSKFKLRSLIYPQFNKTIYSAYVFTAVWKASAILKNYRKAKKKNVCVRTPFMKRRIIVIDNQRYHIIHNHLKFPVRPRQFVYIPLNHHVSEILSKLDIKLGEVTLTENKISISYSKNVSRKEPKGYLGIDMNLENATCVDETGKITVIDTSKIISTKMKYREVLSHMTRPDVRIHKKIKQKYGVKQKNKEDTFLHQISKEIASQGRQVIMENLIGIRKLYRKGNGQGTRFRFRLNSWSRFKLQKMNNYKLMDCNGFPVIFARPNGTTSKCAICGCKLIPEKHRMMRCPTCHVIVDRDENASKNILARGLVMLGYTKPARFEPDAVQGEAMKQFKDVEQIAPNLLVDEPSSG